MATRAELEAELAEGEAELAADAELMVFGILTTGWVRQIEAGTVDWDDLTERLETALKTARRLSGEAR